MRRAVLLVVALSACRGRDEAPTARGGGPQHHAPLIDATAARETVGWARCQHLLTCSQIAPGKRYDDVDACTASERKKIDLACARVDPELLEACTSAIRDKKCDAFVVRWPDACEHVCAPE